MIDKIACTFIPNLTQEFIVKKLLLPLTMIVLLVGCKNEDEELNFEDFFIEEVSETACNTEEENCAFISIQTPFAQQAGQRSKTINQNIENHILGLVDYQEIKDLGSLEELAQRFIDDYETSAEEFKEYNIPWEASVEGRIVHNSPELISLEYKLGLFTGGAHGYTSVSFLNLNPETGEVFSNKDLFTVGFNNYAEKLFRKRNNIPEEGPINSTGFFFEEDNFQLPKNIGFLKNKVILRYNPYEVASYAEGGIQLEIPLEEVQEFIKIL